MGRAILVLCGYRARMANAAIPRAYRECGELDLRQLPRSPQARSEMAGEIAFLALIVTLVFAAVGAVLYVARRFNRG